MIAFITQIHPVAQVALCICVPLAIAYVLGKLLDL